MINFRHCHLATLSFAAVFTTGVVANAKPLATMSLDSSADWTVRRELDSSWQPVAVPTQSTLKGTKNRWIDFRRQMTPPKVARDQTTVLKLDSINDGGEVFVNDRSAGTIDYGLFPAEVNLTRFVTPGQRATITLRCYRRGNYYRKGAFPSGNNGSELLGIPRGVSLAVYGPVHVVDLVTRSSVVRDRLEYDAWIVNDSAVRRTVTIQAELALVSDASWAYPKLIDQTVCLLPNAITQIHADTAWGLGPKSFWWPNIPFDEHYRAVLHRLRLCVHEGNATLDTADCRFGFCEAGEGPNYYTINGVRIFEFVDSTQEHLWSLDGRAGFQTAYAFLPGWVAGLTGATDSWHRYQRLGINTFRLHSSAATEAMLDAADETGMMLVGETAIRGYDPPDETWDDRYKPAAVKAMVDRYRGHPSIVRYSLDNEYKAVTTQPKLAAALIDSAVAEDPTRPMSFSQDKAPWEGEFFSTDHAHHAWVMQHYHQPEASPITIVGVEEMYWDRKGTTKNELIGCAKDAILDRLKGYAAFGPWTINNYWCNFIEGGSKATGTVNPLWRNKDRHDDVDGWGSDLIRFVQNCYSIYASADVDLIEHHLNTEQQIFDPATMPTLVANRPTDRQLVIFNNSLNTHRMSVRWELRAGSATGPAVGYGETPAVTLAAGEHQVPFVTLSLPNSVSRSQDVYFIVHTIVDGAVAFTENRYLFQVAVAAPMAASTRSSMPKF